MEGDVGLPLPDPIVVGDCDCCCCCCPPPLPLDNVVTPAGAGEGVVGGAVRTGDSGN